MQQMVCYTKPLEKSSLETVVGTSINYLAADWINCPSIKANFNQSDQQ